MAPPSDTRQKLVAAGIAALRDLTPATIIGAIGARELARRVGVSSATFFHHFGDLDGYVEALLDALYPTDRSAENDVTMSALLLYAETATPAQVGQLMFGGSVILRAGDPNFRTRLGMWGLGGPSVEQRYSAFMRAAEEPHEAVVERLFAIWSRELRPPIDARFLTAFYGAMQNGVTMHHMVNPDVIDIDRFGQLSTAILTAVLRAQGDRRTLPDRLAELNYVRIEDRRPQRTGPGGARDKVLVAAEDAFANDGYDAASIATIARNAGVSQATVFAHFGTKAGIAAALFDVLVTTGLSAHPEAPDGGLAGYLVAFARPRGELASRFAGSLVQADPLLADDSCRAALTELVTAARAAGVVTSPLPDPELADLVLTIVLSRVVAAPATEPDELVAPAWAVLTAGAAPG